MTSQHLDDKASPKPAFYSPRAWIIMLLVLVLGLTADLSTKYITFATVADQPVELNREELIGNRRVDPIPPHEGIPVLPAQLLDLRLVINPGAVFGIGADQRAFFIVFTLAALGFGLLIFGRWTRSDHPLAHVALGLIMAGGLGNLYDRIRFGVVRDFLHMLPGRELPFGFTWPGGNPEIFPWVFNIADVMLLTGMALLLIHINRIEKERKATEERDSDKPAKGAET